MKTIPTNKTILCIKTDEIKTYTGSFYIQNESVLPIYEIIRISDDLDNFRFKVGDKIICNSTGTKITLKDSEQYIFSNENIAAKIN